MRLYFNAFTGDTSKPKSWSKYAKDSNKEQFKTSKKDVIENEQSKIEDRDSVQNVQFPKSKDTLDKFKEDKKLKDKKIKEKKKDSTVKKILEEVRLCKLYISINVIFFLDVINEFSYFNCSAKMIRYLMNLSNLIAKETLNFGITMHCTLKKKTKLYTKTVMKIILRIKNQNQTKVAMKRKLQKKIFRIKIIWKH